MVVNITNGLQNFTLEELKENSDIIYTWGRGGGGGDLETFNWVTFIFYFYTAIFVGMVMFNILIAIMGGSRSKFMENKKLIDINLVLNMLSSMASFQSSLLLLRRKFGAKEGRRTRKVFFYFVVPKEKEDDQNEQEGENKELKKNMAALEKKMESLDEKLTKIMEYVKPSA